MKKTEAPEYIVLSILGEISDSLPQNSFDAIMELSEHNEVGVALEMLCSQIHEYGIVLSREHKKQMQRVAIMLGIPLSQLDGLAD